MHALLNTVPYTAFSFNDASLAALLALSALCALVTPVRVARDSGCHAAFSSWGDSLHLHKAVWEAKSLCQ